MPQIITKLSERRALKKGKHDANHVTKLLSKMDLEKIESFESHFNSPQKCAEALARMYAAKQVNDEMDKHGIKLPNGMEVNAENVEELLAGLVEGDLVLDSGSVHAFHRRVLDQLRETLARLDGIETETENTFL